ncbi:Xaa-Pro peptidase family protein [Mesorhizobium sp.]|uniref:M24 family metallopeptidase n=1 Tax=Mesorhizobium sp. TaxID=1871066 RepID=UPI0025F1003F|nr:Xaa-Pro peptidase family protein [Mesorhizobium sp.]
MTKTSIIPDFAKAEYEGRCQHAWTLMRERSVEALLLTGDANRRYFAGHRTQHWVSNARPMFALLPEGKEPIVIVAESEGYTASDTSWIKDVRTWHGFADEGLPVIADILRELKLERSRIGVDYGSEMRLGMPVPSFNTLQTLVPQVNFVDGSPILWATRMLKSKSEIEYIRQACSANESGFRHGWSVAQPGMTERDLQRRMAIAMLEGGADRVQWLPLNSGEGNYYKISMEPTERKLQVGETIWCDAGVTVRGYWSDYNRVAAVGRASEEQKSAYRNVWDITRACVEAVKPGVPLAAISEIAKNAFKGPGRIGHGSGLDITEPPSIRSEDDTIIEPGMILHIEPRVVHPFGCFQLEEVIAVTESGYEFLSTPAPQTIPVTGQI